MRRGKPTKMFLFFMTGLMVIIGVLAFAVEGSGMVGDICKACS